jgi:hypothetical protein
MQTRHALVGVALTGAWFAFVTVSCSRQPVGIDAAADAEPIVSSKPDRSPDQASEQVKKLAQTSKQAAPQTGGKNEPFRFPDDRGGKLLETLLSPSERDRKRMAARTEPRRPAARSNLDRPASSPPVSLTPPRPIKLEKSLPALRPASLRDALPLDEYHAHPRLPQPTVLASGPRTRLPSPDVNKPLPLSALASQANERASLDDPTGDASLAAALALSPSPRANPAAFARRNLPDPFEHRDTVKMRKPPAENTTPTTASPRPPDKSP